MSLGCLFHMRNILSIHNEMQKCNEYSNSRKILPNAYFNSAHLQKYSVMMRSIEYLIRYNVIVYFDFHTYLKQSFSCNLFKLQFLPRLCSFHKRHKCVKGFNYVLSIAKVYKGSMNILVETSKQQLPISYYEYQNCIQYIWEMQSMLRVMQDYNRY